MCPTQMRSCWRCGRREGLPLHLSRYVNFKMHWVEKVWRDEDFKIMKLMNFILYRINI